MEGYKHMFGILRMWKLDWRALKGRRCLVYEDWVKKKMFFSTKTLETPKSWISYQIFQTSESFVRGTADLILMRIVFNSFNFDVFICKD